MIHRFKHGHNTVLEVVELSRVQQLHLETSVVIVDHQRVHCEDGSCAVLRLCCAAFGMRVKSQSEDSIASLLRCVVCVLKAKVKLEFSTTGGVYLAMKPC